MNAYPELDVVFSSVHFAVWDRNRLAHRKHALRTFENELGLVGGSLRGVPSDDLWQRATVGKGAEERAAQTKGVNDREPSPIDQAEVWMSERVATAENQ